MFVEERTVDVHIRRLRSALEPSQHDSLIQTVRGTGYRFLPSRKRRTVVYRAAHHTFLACCAGFCGPRDMRRRRSPTPPARQNSGMIRFALRKDVHASPFAS